METIRDISQSLPGALQKLLADYLTPNYLDRTHFETEGDLDELRQLINNQLNSNNQFTNVSHGHSNIEMLIKLHDLALTSWGLISYKDFCKLEPCIEFQSHYPKLFATILVWGWS
jgi:hypothetical protein